MQLPLQISFTQNTGNSDPFKATIPLRVPAAGDPNEMIGNFVVTLNTALFKKYHWHKIKDLMKIV